MQRLKICVNTQTPLVRFNLSYDEMLERYNELPDPVPLKLLHEGVDYDFATCGVTTMVYLMMKKMLADKIIKDVCWNVINPVGPHRASVAETSHRMGENAFEAAKKCSLENGVKSVSNVFSEVVENV